MWCLLLTGGLALFLTPASTQAGETVVQAPFVSVRVSTGHPGSHVSVRAPFVKVYVPTGRPAGVTQQLDVAPPQPVEVLPPPTPGPVIGVQRPLTHREFARTFKPVQGTYDVVLLHPDTCCPVRVCFTLPYGCPKRVRVERHELEFDYGRTEVELRFRRNGTVQVEYRD
jgi:hypothetical protein